MVIPCPYSEKYFLNLLGDYSLSLSGVGHAFKPNYQAI